MSNISYDQFIGVYDDMFSEELCNSYIDFFEKHTKHQTTRQQLGINRFVKDDLSVALSLLDKKEFYKLQDILLSTFWEDYTKKFDYFKEWPIVLPHCKIQKTNPGQGYHVWHTEWHNENPQRAAVFTVYLNDVDEGGETEFLYQHKRVKSKKGRVVIFPAFFPYLHRGNPPLSNTKYILTGWFEIIPK